MALKIPKMAFQQMLKDGSKVGQCVSLVVLYINVLIRKCLNVCN